MQLVLDATPYLVNRTAIHRIVKDTFCGMEDVGPKLRFLNDIRGDFELSSSEAKRIKRRFFRSIQHPFLFLAKQYWLRLFARKRRAIRHVNILYFDPLYTLFHDDLDQSIVFVLDLTPLTEPDWHRWFVRILYHAALKRISSSHCKIVAISASTATDLRVNLGISSSRVSVIPLYQSLKFVTSSSPSDSSRKFEGPYLLFVGSLESRKNLLGLIGAFSRSGLAEKGYHLYVAGGDGKGAEEIRERAAGVKGVELLGFVTDAELEALYSGCAAFIYPSYWEGFGLPLLEAMARGVPCVATETGASPEVGGDCVKYVDPYDEDSIIDGILWAANLSRAERQRISDKSRDRARTFTFEAYLGDLMSTLGIQK